MVKHSQHNQYYNDSLVRRRDAQFETLGYKVIVDLLEWNTPLNYVIMCSN